MVRALLSPSGSFPSRSALSCLDCAIPSVGHRPVTLSSPALRFPRAERARRRVARVRCSSRSFFPPDSEDRSAVIDHALRPNRTKSWPARMPATHRLALAPRPRQPSFEDSSRQRRMADAALSCEGTENLQILLVKAQRDLLGARRLNLDVEILEILCELLHAVMRPEVALFS